MDYAAAKKLITTKKAAQQTYWQVNFGYDAKFILPYAEGLSLMASLQQAEQITDTYAPIPKIEAVRKGSIEITYMSQVDYQRHKIAQLLDVPFDSVKDLENIT